MIFFVVPGRAQPGGSKRAFVRGGRPVVVDANPNVGAWKERVALAAASARGSLTPMSGAVKLTVSFYFTRPAGHTTSKGKLTKSARRFPSCKPDLTKLLRALEDALTSVIWLDDAQVVQTVAEKVYGERDEVLVKVEHVNALLDRPVDGVGAESSACATERPAPRR